MDSVQEDLTKQPAEENRCQKEGCLWKFHVDQNKAWRHSTFLLVTEK